MGIGAHHVRQHVRVTAVALGAGHAVTFPVPPGLQRIHPVDHIPGRDQRGHPRAAVDLSSGDHLRIIGALAQLLPGQLVQPGHPGYPFRQPPAGQHPALLIHQLHVVMVPRPSHRLRTSASILPSEMPDWSAACGGTISALMKQCSRQQAGTTSQQRSTLPVTGRGTVFSQDSRSGGQQCSPAGGHQLTSLPDGEPANTH
jgi:hypothetical protein